VQSPSHNKKKKQRERERCDSFIRLYSSEQHERKRHKNAMNTKQQEVKGLTLSPLPLSATHLKVDD